MCLRIVMLLVMMAGCQFARSQSNFETFLTHFRMAVKKGDAATVIQLSALPMMSVEFGPQLPMLYEPSSEDDTVNVEIDSLHLLHHWDLLFTRKIKKNILHQEASRGDELCAGETHLLKVDFDAHHLWWLTFEKREGQWLWVGTGGISD